MSHFFPLRTDWQGTRQTESTKRQETARAISEDWNGHHDDQWDDHWKGDWDDYWGAVAVGAAVGIAAYAVGTTITATTL